MKLVMAPLMLGLLLASAGCSKPPAAAPAAEEAHGAKKAGEGVSMDAATQVRMGVKIAAVTAGRAPQLVAGYARVIDVGPLAAIESEINTAVAAAASSEEEYRRLQTLAAQDQAASARSVETARAQAAADAARAKLAGRRIGLEWGAGIEKMSDSARSALLTDIASGRAALLRIDVPGNNAAVSRAGVRLEAAGEVSPITLLGPAAAADARLQTTGLLGVVRGAAAQALPTGRMLQADLEIGATVDGFELPAGALVRADNSIWVYVKTGDNSFTRRDVGAGRAFADGWFITGGFKPEEQIVVEGAGSLLAAEHGPVEAE